MVGRLPWDYVVLHLETTNSCLVGVQGRDQPRTQAKGQQSESPRAEGSDEEHDVSVGTVSVLGSTSNIRVLTTGRLGTIPDSHIAPDGTTLENRFKPLVAQMCKDVLECGNACDTYTKKRLIGP